MENFENLPLRLQRFARLVAGGESQANACRIVRPKARCPRQQGSKWARLPRVIAAIEELKADSRAAFADQELRHKTAIYNRANADRSLLAAVVLFGAETAGLPQDPRDWPQELKDCIEGVEITKFGPKVLLSDRNTAARLFSQHMGWMAERHELTGKDGAPIEIDNARERNLALLKSVASRIAGQPTAATTSGSAEPNDSGGSA